MIYYAVISFLLLFIYAYFLKNVIDGLHKIKNQKKGSDELKFVSVIVPFRNESSHIIDCFNGLRNQSYPKDKYEMIFIDDNSTDDSVSKLSSEIKNQNIKILKLNDNSGNAFKKKSVKLGIDNGDGEIIVTTDADCLHKSKWLETLVAHYDKNVAFISGPVEFITKDTIFSNLQKLEFAGLVLTGAGLIGSENPIICNAANLSFRKDIFYEVGGYDDTMNLTSGDDELLMQKIASINKYKIKFAFEKDAIVSTAANESLNKFYQQRKRWASKSLFYKSNTLVIKLAAIFLFYINLIILPFLSIFVNKYFGLLLVFEILFKLVLEFQIMNFGKKHLFANLNMKLFVFAEIVHVPYIIISAISGLFGNYSWKNREVAR